MPTTSSTRCAFFNGAALLGLLAAFLLISVAPASAQDETPQRRESVTIEPYKGPPIFLPEGEAPPPPTQVESRVITEKFPDTDTVRFERRIVKFSDNTIVSDGPQKEYYSSGKLYSEGAFDKGKATGKWTYYHENGQVAKEVEYASGKPNGEVKVFNEEGKPVAVRRYKEGKRDGTWETFGEDGEQKLSEQQYADGRPDGTFRVWFTNGQLRQEGTFVAGKREGVVTEWDRVGEKRAEVNFKDGRKHGSAKLWQRDGSVVEQTFEEGRLVSRG